MTADSLLAGWGELNSRLGFRVIARSLGGVGATPMPRPERVLAPSLPQSQHHPHAQPSEGSMLPGFPAGPSGQSHARNLAQQTVILWGWELG